MLHMQSLMKSRNMDTEFAATRNRDKIVVGGSEGTDSTGHTGINGWIMYLNDTVTHRVYVHGAQR